jgi:hypothetical protein
VTLATEEVKTTAGAGGAEPERNSSKNPAQGGARGRNRDRAPGSRSSTLHAERKLDQRILARLKEKRDQKDPAARFGRSIGAEPRIAAAQRPSEWRPNGARKKIAWEKTPSARRRCSEETHKTGNPSALEENRLGRAGFRA